MKYSKNIQIKLTCILSKFVHLVPPAIRYFCLRPKAKDLGIYLSIYLSMSLSIQRSLFLSVNQYSLATDPGAGIGLVVFYELDSLAIKPTLHHIFYKRTFLIQVDCHGSSNIRRHLGGQRSFTFPCEQEQVVVHVTDRNRPLRTFAVVTSQTISPRCADMMVLKVLMTDSKLLQRPFSAKQTKKFLDNGFILNLSQAPASPSVLSCFFTDGSDMNS